MPFLLVAFGLIYVRPILAADLFAWPVKPELTAMLLGAAYLGGVVFFCTLLASTEWHKVALGLPPVAIFASLLLVTTLMHRDLFSFDRVAGWTWTLIYVVAPPLVAGAWWTNCRRDLGPRPSDPLVSRFVVASSSSAGSQPWASRRCCTWSPTCSIGVRPWRLTPLSARVLAR